MENKAIYTLLYAVIIASAIQAQQYQRLLLPHQEQLSSEHIIQVIEDSEGFLWYATEGGGICRDDGRQVDVFRSDAQRPDLLGSNKVACIADGNGYIIIGTHHGAYLLDKADYTIRRLMQVDDKRVDDIVVATNGHWWLTANRKVFEFSAEGELLRSFSSRWKGEDKYVFRLMEDSRGRIWAAQWEGGLLCLQPSDSLFVEARWDVAAAPSAFAETNHPDELWIGTVGQGVVRYHIADGTTQWQEATGQTVCIDLQPSADKSKMWVTTTDGLALYQLKEHLENITLDGLIPEGTELFNRLDMDSRGNLLVAGKAPNLFAVTDRPQPLWFDGKIHDGTHSWQFVERKGLVLTDQATGDERILSVGSRQLLPVIAHRHEGGMWVTDGQQLFASLPDTLFSVCPIGVRPSAMTDDGNGRVWISTGGNLQSLQTATGQLRMECDEAKDVSALALTPDGTLWLGTIFGELYRCRDGKLELDEYASNEYGDAIVALTVESDGQLLMAFDRYVRRYDPARQTLCQQSIEDDNGYIIQLQPTQPGERWSQPLRAKVVERLPRWLLSWWMILVYAVAFVCLLLLVTHYYILRRQRRRFLDRMRAGEVAITERPAATVSVASAVVSPSDHTATQSSGEEYLEESPRQTIENEWLQKAITQVEANLSNEEYSVEQLSSDMCMSRMTFYRKIQNATGQKPTEFIRTIRLRRAATLLREGRQTVAEISDAVGFSSVSYFSRCFRTMYGVPPTQFTTQGRPSQP